MSSMIDDIYERMNDDLEIPDPEPCDSQIRQFFAGKSILFTGATGFIGKCFVEKMLRDCPELKMLYIVVRPKKGLPLEEKINKYFQNIVFDKLRSVQPNFRKRVTIINGDLQEDRLGISKEDRQLLIDNVDIVVHNGATTKFDEIISVSLKINVLATKHMLDLAMECKHVESFIYVSTAYSHCYQKVIEEKFYDPPGDLSIVYDMINSDTMAKDGLTEEAMKMILGKWPNIYTFSKSYAEDLVRQYGEKANFPCAVYRPSIVSAAHHEPLVGWVSSNSGPAYIFLGSALGAIHTFYYEFEPVDLVPLDYSVNALIALIYDVSNRWKNEKSPVVYNFGSSSENPIRFNELFNILLKEAPSVGTVNLLWFPFFYFVNSKWLFYVLHILLHFIPAIFADIALLLMRKRPRALSLFIMGTKHLNKLFYFGNGGWRIRIPETKKVYQRLNATDRKIFIFNIWEMSWYTFLSVYIRGTRVYVLKESLDNVPKATKFFQRMKLLHNTVKTVIYLLFFYFAIKVLNSLLF